MDPKFVSSKDLLFTLNDLTTSTESLRYKNDPQGFQDFSWGTSLEEIAKQRNIKPLENDPDTDPAATAYWKASNYDLQKKEYLQEQNQLASKFGAPKKDIENPKGYVAYHFYTTDIQFYDLDFGYSISFISLKHDKRSRISEFKK